MADQRNNQLYDESGASQALPPSPSPSIPLEQSGPPKKQQHRRALVILFVLFNLVVTGLLYFWLSSSGLNTTRFIHRQRLEVRPSFNPERGTAYKSVPHSRKASPLKTVREPLTTQKHIPRITRPSLSKITSKSTPLTHRAL